MVYPAIAVSFAHQLFGDDVVATPARALWTGLYVTALVAVGWFRVLLPLRLAVRHQLRVTAVVVEAPGVVSVWVAGQQLDRLGTRPGQYFHWRVLTRPLWRRSHPFSVSAVPVDGRMRFTVKAVGDYTDALLNLRPGVRVLASGPYGALTDRARRGRRVLLVAGGVGVAPLRALLEGLRAEASEITLVCRTDRPDQLIFTDEIDELARERGATVHVIHGPATSDAQTDPLGPHRLTALVPSLFDHDVYVCGPADMVEYTRRSLRTAGVRRQRIHTESFAF
jgi:ferredoxin-NADP reductase